MREIRDDQARTRQLEKDAEKAIPTEEEAWAHLQTCDRSGEGRDFAAGAQEALGKWGEISL